MKLDSKSGQIKGLDVTFQMNSIAKIFDFIKYLKNEKNQKLKKKRKKRENRGNDPKRPKIFFRRPILKTNREK